MKTISNISMLENGAGERQFKATGSLVRPSTASAQADRPALGTLAFRSTNNAFDSDQKPIKQSEVASTISKATQDNSERVEKAIERADINAGPDSDAGSSAPAGSVVSDLISRYAVSDVLLGIVNRHDPKKHSATVCDIYRDMYYHDPTCGSAIELLATIPFSDFSLTGVKDEKMARVFLDSTEAMNCEQLLPNISVDYNCVGGVILGEWDDTDKAYRGVVPHRIDYAQFTQVPVFGVDPLIEVTIPPYLADALKRPEILERYRELIPPELLGEGEEGGKATRMLKPEDTIFIPRRAFLKDFSGVSLLRRALPAWFYEKALIRGTVDQVYKRQRAIGHVTVEHSEEWTPTPEEMNYIASMFLNADLDPLGSILVTRAGVNYNEVRRGDDFLKWTDAFDIIEKIKLRALGISEAFVSAEVTYSQTDHALSVFMENVKDYRNRITRELFYEKVFLRISMAHGYTKKKTGELLTTEMASMFGNSGIYYDQNHELRVQVSSDTPVSIPFAKETGANIFGAKASDFVIPTVVWRKRLMPEADDAYMSVLSLAEEKGVPVTLRHWIAASGMQVDSLMAGLNDDLRLREKVYEYMQELQDLKREFKIGGDAAAEGNAGGEGGGEGDSGEGGDMEFARFMVANKFGKGGTTPRRSVLSRANPDSRQAEIANLDSQGNRRVSTRKGRAIKIERFNKVITEASVNLARKENHLAKLEESKIAEQATRKLYT